MWLSFFVVTIYSHSICNMMMIFDWKRLGLFIISIESMI